MNEGMLIETLGKIPLLRVAARVVKEMNRLAPLMEFANYNEYWRSRINDGRSDRFRERFAVVASLIHGGESVLDIGCGDGAFQKYLRKLKPSCRSLGVDMSSVAVEKLRSQGLDALHISPSDKPYKLPDKIGGEWDIVTMMEVIEHVVEAEDLMRQVMALRPSRIFVTIPNVGCLKHRLRLMFGGRFPVTTILYHMKEHVRFWTVKDFQQWTDTLGLDIRSVHGQFDRGDRIVRWFVKKWPALFASQVVYELTLRNLDG